MIFTIEKEDTMIAAMDVTTTTMITTVGVDTTMEAIRGDGEGVIPALQEGHEGIITTILIPIMTMAAATAITMTAATQIDTLQGIAAVPIPDLPATTALAPAVNVKNYLS